MISKFLLVDDDPDDTELFKEALTTIDDKIEFHSNEDCSSILSQLKRQAIRPEIIFLDINMPNMNGWECLAALKNDPELKNIPVLMYSTSSAAIDGRKAISKGAIGFLEKPTSYDELKAFLLQLVPSASSLIQSDLKRIAATRAYRLVVA